MKLSMPRFNQAQVLVVGDIMLDRYYHGATTRISPEAPVPVVKVNGIEDRPGGAANVALNIAALGAGASVTGLVGEDEAAAVLIDGLSAANVHCDFVTVADKPTITKLRVISRQQQLLRLDFEQGFEASEAVAVSRQAVELSAHVGAIILSDYAKGVLSDPQPLIQRARELAVPVLVDPKGTEFERYRGATLLTPNLNEFELVVGRCETEKELVERGTALLTQLDIEALLVTRGEHGMTLLRRDHPEFHLPAKAKEVFDVTGAGDTVISVLAASLAAGEALPQSVTLANIAASIVVGKLGTAAISGPELRRAIHKESGSGRGVMTDEQLAVVLEDARAHGERVVFTNGCFDIIHAGHVGYLEQAKALGDRLVIAVNDDASITKLKGPGRPVNPLDRRMAVLAGLGSVDWVVPFVEDTPERLLALLKPDILVKGGDYDKKGVVGWEIVEGYGGSVYVMSFVDDCSTTSIVEKIKRQS
ncbi:D-alpha,beta-D-heptose 7-phosphate 1-kinase /D-beta-D-heptose 1-phosphate adenylyltransferase [Sinobacterium caligoides]|uniref:Bifunctional protein HldE n=1 Tax=Sinobacterium caligoides TaxID=933926 RepID=A0A3N2DGE5_9GAMM|nr:bifunctional D-glycero-beta-D-manno-heptose-7-phosphate kinase/D-glycero-beta-D-manno-heptose 1-phosphate adenylyltransferase HldE [Sinobacterium caligoides]ROR98819.1 D-alpha,beta-D-heptose 7-phosphate 1-kinase /D-beta-D-heptose 1-phosphate adenylyltransferase [Sinobacterium caligoides]